MPPAADVGPGDEHAPYVRFVVVNHDGGELLARSVGAILELEWPSERLEIVVVDNASTDASLERLPDADRLTVIRLPINVGFGAANNAALTDLSGIDLVALVNPDAVVDPHFLVPLHAALAHDAELGAACPKIMLGLPGDPIAAEGLVQNAGSAVHRTGNGIDIGLRCPDGAAFAQPRDVFAWCGAAVLLRTRFLDDVGLFEPRLFLYYEDTDLSWRGQARGWRYRYVPDAVAHHRLGAFTGSSSPVAIRHQTANRLLMMVRNAPIRLAVAAWCRALLGVLSATTRRDRDAAARRHGLSDAIRALGWTLRDRRTLGRHQTIDRSTVSRALGDVDLGAQPA